jgi:predicted oxidoreductase
MVSWSFDTTEHALSLQFIEQGAKGQNGILMFRNWSLPSPEAAQNTFGFFDGLTRKLGAEIRVNSPVTSLIVENGAVTGVVVTAKDSTYQVKAKRVILATGGIGSNREMIREFMPEFANSISWSVVGHTGDAISMTRDIKAALNGWGVMGQICFDTINGYDPPFGTLPGASSLWVNDDGNRFADERNHVYTIGPVIQLQPNGNGHCIYDSSSPRIADLEAAIAKGYGYKGNTIEELARNAKINPETLSATVGKYRQDYAAGGDTVYGHRLEEMTPVEAGPFYAMPVHFLMLGTLVGLETDAQGQVLNESGELIPNLFACGEVNVGTMFARHSVASGCGIASAMYSGVLAGSTIANILP